MAYNSYFPMSYQAQTPYQYVPQPQMQAQAQSQPNSGLIWVQGEAGAKSYLVAPNTTVMLMDSESQRFFLKSADASGMPLPLRTFEYTEVAEGPKSPAGAPKDAQSINLSNFVTKDEFEAFKRLTEATLGMSKEESHDE